MPSVPRPQHRRRPPRSRRKAPGSGSRRGWIRWLYVAAGAGLACVIGLWVAVHRVEWMGPLLANSLRTVIGSEAVTWLEECVYGIEDGVNRALRSSEPPKAYWTVPGVAPVSVATAGAPDVPSPAAAMPPAGPNPAVMPPAGPDPAGAMPPAGPDPTGAMPPAGPNQVASATTIPARFKVATGDDATPTATGAMPAAPSASGTVSAKPAGPIPFRPLDPGPMRRFAAPGDGIWVPILDPRRPAEAPYMYKTLLHPDGTRSWTEAFVVAVDLHRVDVFLVAGSQEPKSDNPRLNYKREARIPPEVHEELLAAFNGGFMAEHGGHGMAVDGVVLVHPKPNACTVALYQDGSIRIATWRKIADTEQQMRWWRQAPECMFEGGKIHPGLTAGSGLRWGATLDGDTVIRRSAVGLSADRAVLYVAITNHTTARALADAMQHAGAADVAQMDVNWSYPKFVLFEPQIPGGERKAVPLAHGFEFSEDEYIRKRARRDFFYLVRRPSP